MAIIATGITDFCKHLETIAESVYDYGDTVIITRPNNENLVMISEREYNAMQASLKRLDVAGNRQ